MEWLELGAKALIGALALYGGANVAAKARDRYRRRTEEQRRRLREQADTDPQKQLPRREQ